MNRAPSPTNSRLTPALSELNAADERVVASASNNVPRSMPLFARPLEQKDNHHSPESKDDWIAALKRHDNNLAQVITAIVRFEEGLIDETLLAYVTGFRSSQILELLADPEVRIKAENEKFQREQSGISYRERIRQQLTRFGSTVIQRAMTDEEVSARDQINAVKEARLAAWPDTDAVGNGRPFELTLNFGTVTEVFNYGGDGPPTGYYDEAGSPLTKEEATALMRANTSSRRSTPLGVGDE